jgi:hypothetical protein
MELTKRKIKKVSNEKTIEVAQIKYDVGDILKYYVKIGDNYIINYGKIIFIVNQDLYKVNNLNTNEMDKIKSSDIIKKIDDVIFNDNISGIYNLLFTFLFLQTVAFLCYYLYTYYNKDLIIIGNIINKNFNVFIKNISAQLIVPSNNFNIFIKNATTQLIIYKDKLIKLF